MKTNKNTYEWMVVSGFYGGNYQTSIDKFVAYVHNTANGWDYFVCLRYGDNRIPLIKGESYDMTLAMQLCEKHLDKILNQ